MGENRLGENRIEAKNKILEQKQSRDKGDKDIKDIETNKNKKPRREKKKGEIHAINFYISLKIIEEIQRKNQTLDLKTNFENYLNTVDKYLDVFYALLFNYANYDFQKRGRLKQKDLKQTEIDNNNNKVKNINEYSDDIIKFWDIMQQQQTIQQNTIQQNEQNNLNYDNYKHLFYKCNDNYDNDYLNNSNNSNVNILSMLNDFDYNDKKTINYNDIIKNCLDKNVIHQKMKLSNYMVKLLYLFYLINNTNNNKDKKEQISENDKKQIAQNKSVLVFLDKFGFFDNKIKNLPVVGEKYNVTRERIRQIQNRILWKIYNTPLLSTFLLFNVYFILSIISLKEINHKIKCNFNLFNGEKGVYFFTIDEIIFLLLYISDFHKFQTYFEMGNITNFLYSINSNANFNKKIDIQKNTVDDITNKDPNILLINHFINKFKFLFFISIYYFAFFSKMYYSNKTVASKIVVNALKNKKTKKTNEKEIENLGYGTFKEKKYLLYFFYKINKNYKKELASYFKRIIKIGILNKKGITTNKIILLCFLLSNKKQMTIQEIIDVLIQKYHCFDFYIYNTNKNKKIKRSLLYTLEKLYNKINIKKNNEIYNNDTKKVIDKEIKKINSKLYKIIYDFINNSIRYKNTTVRGFKSDSDVYCFRRIIKNKKIYYEFKNLNAFIR